MIRRALIAALVGGLAGGLSVIAIFAARPGLTFEMDRDVPGITSGISPVERFQDETYAWTAPRAAVRFAGMDRRRAWACDVRLRGSRPAGVPQPSVDITADGVSRARVIATDIYQNVRVDVPPRPNNPGLILTLNVTPPFVPGRGDERELGVQLDALTCAPAEGGFPLPPRAAIVAAATSGAAFALALGLIGVGFWGAAGAATLVAVAQAIPIAAGPGLYYPAYLARATTLAILVPLALTLGVRLIELARHGAISGLARFAAAFSAGALLVKLLALLHPWKEPVDIVFHAHRLDWVLSGRYFFPQPLPDGVAFPYAIGLYVFAAPWSLLTTDHAALLRIVVASAEAVAGLVLYLLVARAGSDQARAAAVAVVLFHLVPLPYVVVGNANMTFAFAQSASILTLAAATIFGLRWRDVFQFIGLVLVAALAFLSHVGVFPILAAMLVLLAALYWWSGGSLRAPARGIVLATTIAVLLSVGLYYRHFGEEYRTMRRVRAQAAAPATPGTETARSREAGSAMVPVGERASRALALAPRAFGWPLLLLAAAGVWRTRTRGDQPAGPDGRRRLDLLILSVALTCAGFVLFTVLAPVEIRFQRYADEFIDRVNYMALPAVAILAARGAARAWSAGWGPRLATIGLLGAAAVVGIGRWLSWLR